MKNSATKLESHPIRIILSHYESLIQEIDIFIEEELELDCSSNAKRKVEIKLNRLREMLINEAKLAEAKTLEFYENGIKEELRNDQNLQTIGDVNEKIALLKRKLFANKYSFILKKSNPQYFCLRLVILDFYLDPAETALLKFEDFRYYIF